jgi:hypothetical protein
VLHRDEAQILTVGEGRIARSGERRRSGSLRGSQRVTLGPVTRWGTPHLRLVAPAEETEPAAPEPVPVRSPVTRWAPITGTTIALAVVLGLLAGQPWALPSRVAGAVTAVPQSLVTFLLVCAGVCLWAAGRATRPAATFRSATSAQLWWVTVVGTAVVSVAADLSLAASGGAGERPADLLARWLVAAVPAVVAGALARRDGRAARLRAALGTGVVSLPLFAVGWALYASPVGVALATADVVSMVLLAGVTPFVLAIAFVAAERKP